MRGIGFKKGDSADFVETRSFKQNFKKRSKKLLTK